MPQPPEKVARELYPDDFHRFSTQMSFLFFVLEAPPATGSAE
ncbi:hypothetical protein ACIPSA_28220 [Streptomyces sp. NPDC086549]